MSNNDYLKECAIWAIRIAIALYLAYLAFLCAGIAKAQNVKRVGNTFVQDSTSHRFAKKNVTLTKYYYQASDGTKYPIYMSESGKCFIIKTSKKTGKEYKQYLPKITKELQNENSRK